MVDWEHLDSKKQFDFPWGDLRIDGYLKGLKVISRSLAGDGTIESSSFCLTMTRLSQMVPIQPESFCESLINSAMSGPTQTTR